MNVIRERIGMVIRPRRSAWFSAALRAGIPALWLAASIGLRAQTSPVYGMFDGQEFMQVGGFTSPYRAAYWTVWAQGYPPGELEDAQLLTQLGKAFEMSVDGKAGNATGGEDYMTAQQRETDHPVGTYTLEVTKQMGPRRPWL